jgi:hypothetical protein
LAIFFGLLERTIRQRVIFMVKAKAAGNAKIFMESPFSKSLTVHFPGRRVE